MENRKIQQKRFCIFDLHLNNGINLKKLDLFNLFCGKETSCNQL